MKQSSSFFSSKHSALVLGLMLGASALVGSITYAQLNIPSNIENMRIAIRQIFLSPTGTNVENTAPIVLDGMRGNITLNGIPNRVGGTEGGDLITNGSVTFKKLLCSQVMAPKLRTSLNRTQATQVDNGPILEAEEIYCVLMTDANGTVHVRTRKQFNDRMGSTNGDVFKRNPSNANDSFFATASGSEATVGSNNFLRVGTRLNTANTSQIKADTAMVVGGSIESRGGTFIKKVDGQQANQGDNLNVEIKNNYTALDNRLENGTIFFESEKMGSNPFSPKQPTNFVFTAKGAQTSLGINTTNPEATLHVERGGTVQFGNRGMSIDTSSCRWEGDPRRRIEENRDRLIKENGEERVRALEESIANGEEPRFNQSMYDAGIIACDVTESFPTVSVNTDRNETFMLGNIRMNYYTGSDSFYNNYQLPTGVYPSFMNVVRPSWLNMISAGNYWHNGIMNVGTNVRDTRSMFNTNTATIQNGLRVGIPDRTNSWSSVPLEVNGNQVKLAEFIRKIPDYPTPAWDSTALIDIVNGAKVRWRYGVGGTGNNSLSMNDSQFYIEREGAGSLFTISSGGRVGIGTNLAKPEKKLDVRGNASITENLIIGHDAAFDPGSDRLNVNGSARANAYYYNSDAKYKSDITPLTSSLDNILKLNGYSYYNKLSEKNDIGVIAQEVEKVFPSLVQTDADGYKSVAYGNLVAPLIEAVKELSAKIDELFDKYVDQQAQIDALEARIQALEQAK